MPTVYKNKGEKNLWNDEQFHAAMEAVSSGELKAHAAAKQYGIPSSTLHDHIKGKSTKRYGCAPTVLTAEEKEIVTGPANPDHLLNSSAHATCSAQRTALLLTSKHPSAPITTPVHHHSCSTVVYTPCMQRIPVFNHNYSSSLPFIVHASFLLTT